MAVDGINLKLVLMNLGNRLVHERHFDPSVVTDNPSNTHPITDFVNWVNGCEDAQTLLWEAGFSWPVNLNPKPTPTLRDELRTLSKTYADIGDQCERFKNTSGAMQMRSISNILYAIVQGREVETIVPFEEEVRDESIRVTFKGEYIIRCSSISTTVCKALDRISLCDGDEGSWFEYYEESGEIHISMETHIFGKEASEQFSNLLSELQTEFKPFVL